MQKITPCLWFDTQAEEAANFYVSIFRDSRIGEIVRYGDAGPGPKGSVLTIAFELAGQSYLALNGGPYFKFNEALSLMVHCRDQAEIDEMWARLSEGGETSQCGWLKDRYGLSWQVVPESMPQLMAGDPERAGRVMEAVMKMTRLDLAAMEAAARG